MKTGLFEAFKIPMAKFLNFFFALERGYHDIPCKYYYSYVKFFLLSRLRKRLACCKNILPLFPQ